MKCSFMLRWRLVVACLLSLLATTALAQGVKREQSQSSRSMTFNGVGTHSCGEYMQNMKGLQADMYKIAYQQWGAGFFAGVSNDGSGNPVADPPTINAWLDKWCADDPASSMAKGTIGLGKRLISGK